MTTTQQEEILKLLKFQQSLGKFRITETREEGSITPSDVASMQKNMDFQRKKNPTNPYSYLFEEDFIEENCSTDESQENQDKNHTIQVKTWNDANKQTQSIIRKVYSTLKLPSNKCVGVLEVTLQNGFTHYFVGISGNGKGEAGEKVRWDNNSLINLRGTFSSYPNIHIAEFNSCICANTQKKSMLDSENVSSFLERIIQKRNNLQRGLQNLDDEQRNNKIKEVLENSLLKEEIDKNPNQSQEDMNEIVCFYQFLANPNTSDDIISNLAELCTKSREEIKKEFPAELAKLLDDKILYNLTKDEKLDCMERICKKFGIEERLFGLVAHAWNIIPDPQTTKLLDFVVQCAEDNALVCFLEVFHSVEQRNHISKIYWTSTCKKKNEIQNKACPVCSLCFVERLEDLLKQ